MLLGNFAPALMCRMTVQNTYPSGSCSGRCSPVTPLSYWENSMLMRHWVEPEYWTEGSHEAEEGLLLGLVSVWDSGGSWQELVDQADFLSSISWSKTSSVGWVWWGHGRRYFVNLKAILPKCQVTREGKCCSTHTVYRGGGVLLTCWPNKEYFEDLLNPLTCLP